MKKTKIFEETFVSRLESDINGLIADENVDLIDVKFTYNSCNNMYAAVVIYSKRYISC